MGITTQNTRILQRAFIALFFIPKNLLYIRYIYMKYELNVPTSLNEITLGQYQQYGGGATITEM